MTCMYESDLVKVVGLHTAIMMSILQQEQNNTPSAELIDDMYFCLDQNKITKYTGFAKQEQDLILKALIKCGVLIRKSTKTPLVLCYNENFDPSKLKELGVIDKQTQKELERNSKIKFLRTKVETQNTELLQAYFDWIDVMFDKQGWLPAKAIEVAQSTLDEFTNRDLDVALEILTIATIHGYRDISWAINTYVDRRKNAPKVKTNVYTSKPEVNTFTDEVF